MLVVAGDGGRAKSGPGQRSRLLQPPARCRPLVPHSRADAVAKAVRVSAATVGIEHRPIQTGVEGLADVRKPGAAVWTEHRPIQFGRVAFPTLRPPRLSAVRGTGAVDEAWKTHGRCRSGQCRCGSRTEYQEHHQELTPGDTKADPFVINGTALTGLSTLCPRRRSSSNQLAVVKGWTTPSTTSADRRFRLFAMPPVPKHRPIQSAKEVRRKPPNTVDIYSIRA